MSQSLLTINDIAMMLAMPDGKLRKNLRRIEGFPKPVGKHGHYRVYQREAVETYLHQHNLNEQINECLRQDYRKRYLKQKAESVKSGLNNALAMQFLSGNFSPSAPRIERLGSPLPRNRTRVVSHWYDDTYSI